MPNRGIVSSSKPVALSKLDVATPNAPIDFELSLIDFCRMCTGVKGRIAEIDAFQAKNLRVWKCEIFKTRFRNCRPFRFAKFTLKTVSWCKILDFESLVEWPSNLELLAPKGAFPSLEYLSFFGARIWLVTAIPQFCSTVTSFIDFICSNVADPYRCEPPESAT